jgi:predicted Zn-dependent peptidase
VATTEAREETIPGGAKMISNLRLPGGAALAAEEAEGARSFAIGFWFPLGSRHEAPLERGFVHFVEHMVFKGSGQRSAGELSRAIERVGGYLNAFTDRDSICVHCQVPADEWRLALDILTDMAFCSSFKADDFEREREVIISEILAGLDDPEECSHDEFLASIWPGDPLSWKIAGEPEDIKRITRDALYNFYISELIPSRLLVTSAGPVRAEVVALELARLFESLPADRLSRAARARPEKTPVFSAGRSYRKVAMEQVHYYEAVQVEGPFSEDDYYALSAVNGELGESSSSRLFLSLREDRGLCYSVYSGFAMTKTECLWMASASASSKVLPELSSEMDRQLDRAAGSGLTDGECEDAIARLVGGFDVALDDPDFRMRRIARQILFSGQAETEEEARSRMLDLSGAAINAMCDRLLKGRERAHFAYGKLSRREAAASGLCREAARRG